MYRTVSGASDDASLSVASFDGDVARALFTLAPASAPVAAAPPLGRIVTTSASNDPVIGTAKAGGTPVAPQTANTNVDPHSQYGTAGDPTQISTFHIIPETPFGLSSLGASGLQTLADYLPLVDYLPDEVNHPGSSDQLVLRSPGIAGYDLRAYLGAEFSFGLDFDYRLDLGAINASAVVTSALQLVDNDPEGYAADSDPDLYTDYTLDTSLAKFNISLFGTNATTNSYAALHAFGSAKFGIYGAGLYDDGTLDRGGDILSIDKTFDHTEVLFDQSPATAVGDFNLEFLRGSIAVPTLPQLALNSGAIGGADVYESFATSGTGPSFAQLTLDPVPLIPILGEINTGSYDLIESYLVDAGFSWTLLTAQATIGAALTQTLSAKITGVDVFARVDEFNTTTQTYDMGLQSAVVPYGSKIDLKFSTGDHDNTHIVEDYTIHVHVTSEIDLTPILSLNFGLLYFEAYINPILIDELRVGLQLFSANASIAITSFQIAPDIGFDVELHAQITTTVDTHLPVVGTEFSDNGTVGSDGNLHPTLDLAGNQYDVDGYAGDDIVNGNPSANLINGGSDNDILYGNDGDDVIHGGSGWDSLYGGNGKDVLYSEAGGTGAGQEFLDGGDDDDILYAGATAATLYGGAGNDSINLAVARYGGQFVDGGSGTNTLSLNYLALHHGVVLDLSNNATSGTILAGGTDPDDGTAVLASTYVNIARLDIVGSNYDDTVTGADGGNFIATQGGNDTIHGGNGDNSLFGGAGNDTIYGNAGSDAVYGQSGDDVIYGYDGNDFLRGNDGNDYIDVGRGADYASGGAGDDLIIDDLDENANDDLHGGDGNDVIVGGGGFDTIHGDSGDDQLFASALGGMVYGGEGKDRLEARAGATLDGGLGSDTYVVDATDLGITIIDTDPREDNDPFSERANDTLILTGGTSATLATGNVPAGTVVFGQDGTLVTFGGATIGTYTGIDSFYLTGSDGDDKWVVDSLGSDILHGGAGNDYLDGGIIGNDYLDGGDGDDSIVGEQSDTIVGGAGVDTLYWRSARTGQVLSIGDPASLIDPVTGVGTLVGSSTLGHTITGIERLVMIGDGGLGNDRITGGGLDDTIRGGAGDDVLSGLAGDDTIVAGTGGDTVYGGDGNDTIDLTDLEVVAITTTFRKEVHGNLIINIPVPIPGDVAYGGSGNDTITATNTASFIDGGTGDDTITISDGGYRGDFVTEVEGGDGNDHIVGSSEGELLVGGTDARRIPAEYTKAVDLSDTPGLDDDFIDGAGGNDEIWGGRGNDTIFAGTGTDVVHGGTGNDVITGDATDTLYGDEGNDDLTTLGGSGLTLLDGGAGDDIARFDLTGTATAVAFTLTPDTMVNADIHLVSIERLSVTLTDGADTVTGGGEDDTIIGGKGADILHGGGGNDDLVATSRLPDLSDAGGDFLYGDGGDDYLEVNAAATVDGGTGTDTLVVRGLNAAFANATLVSNGAGSFGPINYTGIETLEYHADRAGAAVHITTGAGNDTLFGTDQDDVFIAGDGANQVFGYGGNDQISVGLGPVASYVDGGDGVDTVTLDLSGTGQDLYLSLDNSPFGTPPPTGAFVAATLVNVEKIIVTTGSGNDTVIGGFGDDVIYTGAGNDVVNSQSGTDYVDLGAGDDTLTDLGFASGIEHFYGGDGNDTIHIGSQRAVVDGGNGNDFILVTEFFYGLPQFDTPDDIDGGAGDDVISSNSLGTFHGGAGTDRIINDLTKAGAQTLDLTTGGTYVFGANWSYDGFELYSLKFGSGSDTVTVKYAAHDLQGGSGDDTLTIVADSRADTSFTIETDFFGTQTMVFANGMRVTGFEHVTVQSVDTPAVGVADSGSTREDATAIVAALDNDVEDDGGPRTILSIAGSAVSAGGTVTLASGAVVTLNANGTLSYDPHHAFDYLQSAATAAGSGGVSSATDSFSYGLLGGGSATVTMTITGVDGVGDQVRGGAGNDTVTGSPTTASYFPLSQGGDDTATGGSANDGFFLGAAFTGADRIDGGAGSNDQIGLLGDYTGANALVLQAATIAGVETIAVQPGFDYSVTTVDANVGAGQVLTIYGSELGVGDDLTFDGSAELDGMFRVFGGLGADTITTGGGNDGIYFGAGRFNPATDHVDGGAGTNDQMALDGSYTVTIARANVVNVETLVLLDGQPALPATYAITLADDWTQGAEVHTVYGVTVRGGFTVDGSAETGSMLRFYGGAGNDTLTGGSAGNWIDGGAGADTMTGGAGVDTFYYYTAVNSMGVNHDTIVNFDVSLDRIDLPFTVTGIDAAKTGALSTASFDADLTAALGALGANHAVQFTALGGTLDGRTFEVIDANGVAGYQAGQDMVIELVTPTAPIATTAPFI